MRRSILILSGVFLSSCATPYTPPPTNLMPPPLWAGSAETLPIPGSLSVSLGIKKVGDVIVEESLDVSRQGMIMDEIRYKDPFGKEVVIPKNTRVHGEQISVTRTTTQNSVLTSSVDLNADNNPIEWCYQIPAETACIFWEGETRARYISMLAMSPRRFMGFQATGMIGPMPNIVEGPVDFGGPMVRSTVITKIDNIGIDLTVTLKDGPAPPSRFSAPKIISWNNQDVVAFMGFNFKAIRNASGFIDSVDVTAAQ